jgi:hypothetical protein
MINEKLEKKKEHEKEILACEQEINVVISQHTTEQEDINNIKKELSTISSDVSSQEGVLNKEQEVLAQKNNIFTEEKRMVLSYVESLQNMNTELVEFRSKHNQLEESLTKYLQAEDATTSQYIKLENRKSTLIGSLAYKNKKQEMLIKKIKEVQNEVEGISKKASSLEEEKKAFLEARKFKEAGKVNEVIKQTLLDKEKKKKEEEALINTQKENANDIESISKDLENTKAQAAEADTSVKLISLNLLVLRVNIAKLLESELSTFNLHENLIVSLRNEIKCCEAEIVQMETTYHIRLEEDFSHLSDAQKKQMLEETQTKIHEMETEINNAVQNEKYDTADALQKQLDNLNEKLTKLQS